MARPGRHIHAKREERAKEYAVYAPNGWEKTGTEPGVEGVAACGYAGRIDQDRSSVRFADEGGLVTCPACNKKLGAQLMRERQRAGGPALDIVLDAQATGGFRYKQGYKVNLDGETIGYIGYEEHAWRLYKLVIAPERGGGEVVRNAHHPVEESGETCSLSWGRIRDAAKFPSRDHAALAAEAYLRAGKIKTGAALRAERAEANAAYEKKQAERQAREAQAGDRKREVLGGLREVLTLDLNNQQRDSVVAAIEQIENRPWKTVRPEGVDVAA